MEYNRAQKVIWFPKPWVARSSRVWSNSRVNLQFDLLTFVRCLKAFIPPEILPVECKTHVSTSSPTLFSPWITRSTMSLNFI